MESANQSLLKNNLKIEILKFYKAIESFFLHTDLCPLNRSFQDMLKINIQQYNSEDNMSNLFNEDSEFKLRNYKITENKEYVFKSYPVNNMLMIFCNNFLLSVKNKRFVFKFENLSGFKDNTEQKVDYLNSVFSDSNYCMMVEKLIQSSDSQKETENENEKTKECLQNNSDLEEINNLKFKLLEKIGDRGLLTLLGIRFTPGSIDYLPIDLNYLKEGFKDLHTTIATNPNTKKVSILSVGARALCKHSHRSSEVKFIFINLKKGFWPETKGKEIEKNKKAEEMLDKFIKDCVWINIHGLPHDTPIIELRNSLGYGIRWTTAGTFRGFLEPQMSDGHEKGWKH